MPYAVGQIIQASDYNVLASQVNLIMLMGTGDFGYGQDGVLVATSTDKTLAVVAEGGIIRASDWVEWRNNINDFNVHQGTDVAAEASAVVPPATDFEIGDLVLAYDGSDSRWNAPANLDQSASARLVVDAGQVALGGSVLTNKRNTGWNTQLQHIFTAKFSDGDAARHFFNSGGQILIRSELIGVANSKNDDWRSIIARASTYIFDASVYFDVSASTGAITRRTVTGSATAYTANDFLLAEQRDHVNGTRGSMGSTITFLVQFRDDAVEGVDENVTGSLTNIIDQRVSTGVIVGSGATYATIVSMSAGS